MNKEDFVKFNQAMKLAKLGFDYETFMYYQVSDGELIDNGLRKDFNWKVRNNPERSTSLSCPTLSQACKWIRSKGISVHVYINGIRNMFYNEIWETKCNGRSTGASELFDSYEEAQSAGIDIALEILESELPQP